MRYLIRKSDGKIVYFDNENQIEFDKNVVIIKDNKYDLVFYEIVEENDLDFIPNLYIDGKFLPHNHKKSKKELLEQLKEADNIVTRLQEDIIRILCKKSSILRHFKLLYF